MALSIRKIPPEVEESGRRVIGCGITVHRILGPGYREIVYRRAFCLELEEQGLRYETEKRILVPYKKWEIDGHRLDFLIERCIVVEIKSIPCVKMVHRLQIRSYLKATGLRLGYVMNFNEDIFKYGLKRVAL
jgi:GxxExxY protein